MTDNEIIKALESEVKSAEYVDSEYCDGVDLTLIKSAIDLINRQKAEIEKLERTISYLEGVCESTPDKIRVEAVEEFAEKLNKRFYLCAGRCVVDVYHIDNLLKEYEKGR